MILEKTRNGSYAKQIAIGSDFTSFDTFASREEAEQRITIYRQGECEIREFTASERVAKKIGVPVGSTVYSVGTKKKQKQVMTHATAAECRAAGSEPGPMNV